ncbi:polysaccharide pyruvyl transferase family protein [Citricoccus sp.]|uniref:polysaccharide pyruvyl transferase family protein n=1 Tax=Citricoccus sp. TaxID=1978372 RepID=UPI00261763C2|nr:polysaccharide pyruvyl transferase family protein [Citricoccus sp.]HRO31512.1 polysaccharide pyruvyl transferase family protein [Citricoccus sp.]HRO94122.1 polysaccharide pyruvyl transferase family protein [Citricoccus sp.]
MSDFPAYGQQPLPTLVSFYAGDQYYHDAAARLREDCERLGMPHHIEELPAEGLDWGAITREKIGFYRRMHDRFGAILWVDVDTRLVGLPEVLRGSHFDLVGFGGRFRYIREYDPYQTARFWVPSYLYFGPTQAASDFLDLMLDIEGETEERVTDDYILQEAWSRHELPLSVGLLPPDMMLRPTETPTHRSVFLHGHSGNVSSFRDQVVQHQNAADNPAVRSRVLGAEAVDAMKAGNRFAAIRLAERSLDSLPTDPDAAIRLSRYLKLDRQHEESVAVLRSQLQENPTLDATRQELAVRLKERHDFAGARREAEHVLTGASSAAAARAAELLDEIGRDERARDLGIGPARRLRMWWMKTPYPGNFGDVLSPWVVEWVTGQPPAFGQRDRSLLAIGSVIKFARERSTVWGSGTPRRGDAMDPNARYLAVRGPVTREEVLAGGGSCPEVYGDPALLLPRFVSGHQGPKQHEVGFIRHVSQDNLDLHLDDVADIRLSGVGEGFLRSVVDQITSCERIVSTSLHGVIVANAYGIPARWAVMGDASEAISGDGTKFEDYFRSVGLEPQAPLEVSRHSPITPSLADGLPDTVELDFDGDALAGALREGLGL